MSLEACARLVEAGDPDRFLATMAAPEPERARLWPIYAFNLEIARAPWASSEPLIAEMRLQFWRDALAAIEAGRAPPAHEVAEPLAEVIATARLPLAPFREMTEARLWDTGRAPFDDEEALLAHIDASAGNLMEVAACALAGPEAAVPPVRYAARASGLANWLVAVPELEARGRIPLVDGRSEAVAALARRGQEMLRAARRERARVPAKAAPALLAGWRAGALLRMAAQEPRRVGEGRLVQSEFARRGSLLLRALAGRW